MKFRMIFPHNPFNGKLKQEGRRVGVYPISQNDWIDMGDWNEYLKLIKNNHEKILIVGGVYDKHAYRFISHLKRKIIV